MCVWYYWYFTAIGETIVIDIDDAQLIVIHKEKLTLQKLFRQKSTEAILKLLKRFYWKLFICFSNKSEWWERENVTDKKQEVM